MAIRHGGGGRSGTLRVLGAATLLLAGCSSLLPPPETAPEASRPSVPAPRSSRDAGEPEDPSAPLWTYGAVRGTVANLKRDGAVVIRVAVGRKSVEFLVPAKSPKAGELASLLGKQVEAEGRMEMGKGSERILVAMEVVEVTDD